MVFMLVDRILSFYFGHKMNCQEKQMGCLAFHIQKKKTHFTAHPTDYNKTTRTLNEADEEKGREREREEAAARADCTINSDKPL